MVILKHKPFLDDLQAIASAIQVENPEAAYRFVDSVQDLLGILSQFPQAGSIANIQTKPAKQVRVLRIPDFRNYLVYFSFDKQQIEFFRIIHGARDQQVAWQEGLED